MNRGAPQVLKEFAKNKQPRNSLMYRKKKDKNTFVICWQDTRMVQLITNLIGPETDPHKSKKKSKKNGRYVYEEFDMRRPKVVPVYSQMMKGVDQFDQNMSYYHFYRRSSKWTTKMNLYLLQAMLQNAHTLYRQFSTDEKKLKLSHLEFQLVAAECLIDFDPNCWLDDPSATITPNEKLPESERLWSPSKVKDLPIARHARCADAHLLPADLNIMEDIPMFDLDLDSTPVSIPGEADAQLPGTVDLASDVAIMEDIHVYTPVSTPGEADAQLTVSTPVSTPGEADAQLPGAGDLASDVGILDRIPVSESVSTHGESDAQLPETGDLVTNVGILDRIPLSTPVSTPGEADAQLPNVGDLALDMGILDHIPVSTPASTNGESDTQLPGIADLTLDVGILNLIPVSTPVSTHGVPVDVAVEAGLQVPATGAILEIEGLGVVSNIDINVEALGIEANGNIAANADIVAPPPPKKRRIRVEDPECRLDQKIFHRLERINGLNLGGGIDNRKDCRVCMLRYKRRSKCSKICNICKIALCDFEMKDKTDPSKYRKCLDLYHSISHKILRLWKNKV